MHPLIPGILAIVLAAVAVVLVVRSQRGSDRATPISPEDPLWLDAIDNARASFGTARELHTDGREVWMKFPFDTAAGEREHVWGKLVSIDGDVLTCTIETPPISGGPVQDETIEVRAGELEDWQVLLDDGSIRGGYTTRAQVRIAEREGQRVPPHVRAIVERMID